MHTIKGARIQTPRKQPRFHEPLKRPRRDPNLHVNELEVPLHGKLRFIIDLYNNSLNDNERALLFSLNFVFSSFEF